MRRAVVATVIAVLATTIVVVAPANAKPAPKPGLSATTRTVAETGRAAVVALKLSKTATKTVKVAWATKDGTARAGSDYTKSSGTVIIKEGRRTGTITVPVLDDAAHEGTESFTVILASKQAKSARPVTVTINDNDAPPPPAPTAPSALAGTITVVRTSPDPGFLTRQVTTTLTMNVHLMPTATPGQWRDNGSGGWTINGAASDLAPGCFGFENSTKVADAGTFLTDAGAPSAKRAGLVLTGFDAAGAAGTPSLSWTGTSAATRTTAGAFCMPGLPPPYTTDEFTWDLTQAAPGSYTGTTGAGRGLTLGSGDPATTQVTGSLVPIP